MISTVAIAKGTNRLDAADNAINLLGGISRHINKGDTVFIKPNLMFGIGMLCNTNPDLIRLIVHKCLKAGAKKVYVGETAMSQVEAEKAFDWTRIKQYVEKYGGIMVNLEKSEYKEKEFDGLLSKKIKLPAELLESDFYINMSKLKTHCITKITCGIKNSLGLLLDNDKRTNHSFDLLDAKLVDIVRARKPDLSIVDGYVAMEGEGPGFGNPVKMGLCIAGNDVIATDAVCCRLMGIDPMSVKTVAIGNKLGVGTVDPRVVGEKIENYARQFKVPTQDIKDVGSVIKFYIGNDKCGCPSIMRIASTFLYAFSRMFPYLFKTTTKRINIIAGAYKGQTRPCDLTLLMGDCAAINYVSKGERIVKVQKACGVKSRGEQKAIECPVSDAWLTLIEEIGKELGGPFNLRLISSVLEMAKR